MTFNSTDGTVTGLTATTAAGGTYVIPPPPATDGNVPASTYTGTAVGPNNTNGKPEYGAGTAQTVTVPAGGSATANFTLPVILASVSGTVTDVQTSAAIAGATVTLTDPSGAAVGTQTTGTGGSFAFTGILATQTEQAYTLSVSKTGYTPGGASVSLALGDAVTQNVPLNEQATLFGLVTDGSPDATGNPPLAGVTITVRDTAGNTVATVPTPVTTAASTAIAADGQPENYLATLLPGTYTVTASKGSYTAQTSATVTLTNAAPVRVNFALVSGIGTLGGLVTDQNGTGLVSGATITAVPTGTTGTTGVTSGISFTTATSASPGPDGSPLNYTGQLPQGTYSVTVTKGSRTSAAKMVTVAGGAFTRLDFTGTTGLPALHTFAAGFQFVSTPYDYSALGFDGLFGTLNTAASGTTPNGNRSHVAVWNPLVGAYALDPNAPADSLRLGVGYWVYLKNAVPVTQQGATPAGRHGLRVARHGLEPDRRPEPIRRRYPGRESAVRQRRGRNDHVLAGQQRPVQSGDTPPVFLCRQRLPDRFVYGGIDPVERLLDLCQCAGDAGDPDALTEPTAEAGGIRCPLLRGRLSCFMFC